MDELVAWIGRQIAADRAAWTPVLSAARKNGKATAADVLAQCESRERIVEYAVGMTHPEDAVGPVSAEVKAVAEYSGMYLLKLVAISYRFREGFQEEWGQPGSMPSLEALRRAAQESVS